MERNQWKTYAFDRVFTIDVPEDTVLHYEDDGTMLVFTLPGPTPTDILAGLFPLEEQLTVSSALVHQRLKHFMEDCLPPLEFVSYEPAVDCEDAGASVWQAVGKLSGDHWWLARIYGRLGNSDILLVHWNGPEILLKTVVLTSFVSIQLNC